MSQTSGSGYVATQETNGEFRRDTRYINDRILSSVAVPTTQTDGTTSWPAIPHAYRLVAARACPWAHRSVITRRIKGLEDAISLGFCGPTHDATSWTFDLDAEGRDPVLGLTHLQQAYFNRFPDYPRGITVPAIVDIASKQVVTNDYPSLVPDLNSEWEDFARPSAPDLYPAELRPEIDAMTSFLFSEVNNGVYRCGFAGTQSAYEAAYERLWQGLDKLEQHLSSQRYLVGEHITLADVYLYPTLVRFDVVYYSHFKCSRNRIQDMPALWGYLRDLFQTPGFGDTTDFQEIKEHYFIVHADINPTQIVPQGPHLQDLLTPHGREALGGTPFAPGTTPPDTIRPEERVKNPFPGQETLWS